MVKNLLGLAFVVGGAVGLPPDHVLLVRTDSRYCEPDEFKEFEVTGKDLKAVDIKNDILLFAPMKTSVTYEEGPTPAPNECQLLTKVKVKKSDFKGAYEKSVIPRKAECSASQIFRRGLKPDDNDSESRIRGMDSNPSTSAKRFDTFQEGSCGWKYNELFHRPDDEVDGDSSGKNSKQRFWRAKFVNELEDEMIANILQEIDNILIEKRSVGASQHGASQHGASQHSASRRGASRHGASRRGASRHGASRRGASSQHGDASQLGGGA